MAKITEAGGNSLIPMYIEKALTQKTLELMSFGVACSVCREIHQAPPNFMQHLKGYIIQTWAQDAITVAAKWYCPAELKREIRFTANWWEAIKERFFPQWALNRWPVSYHVFRIYEMFPEVAWPKRGGHRRNVLIDESSDATS